MTASDAVPLAATATATATSTANHKNTDLNNVPHMNGTLQNNIDASPQQVPAIPAPATEQADLTSKPLQPESSPSSSSSSTSNPGYPTFITPTDIPFPPFVDVSGVPNFRDIGGYQTAKVNQVVRRGLFYRCAHLAQITSEGLATIASTLGVKAIYDLRSETEVQKTTAAAIATMSNGNAEGTIPSTSTTYQNLRHFTPVYTKRDTGPEALAHQLKWYTSAESQPIPSASLPYPYSEGFVNAYRQISQQGATAYRTIFQHILERPNDPMIFHCTAGKDRTGVFAALVLKLAGVDDETVAWEYALTEPGLGEWRRIFIHRLASGPSSPPPSSPTTSTSPLEEEEEGKEKQADPEKDRTSPGGNALPSTAITREEAARIAGSRAGNMRAWLELVLQSEFGGVETYMADQLGFTAQEIAQIRENVLVDRSTSSTSVVVIKPQDIKIQDWSPYDGMAL